MTDDDIIALAINEGAVDLSGLADGSLTMFPEELISFARKLMTVEKLRVLNIADDVNK
jgi:hypothetical protein